MNYEANDKAQSMYCSPHRCIYIMLGFMESDAALSSPVSCDYV